MATALEMYATDNKGHYPSSIEYLTAQSPEGKVPYMRKIPACITPENYREKFLAAFGKNPQKSYKYVVAQEPDNFTIWCTVNNGHFAGYPEGYPQYAPGQGLILK